MEEPKSEHMHLEEGVEDTRLGKGVDADANSIIVDYSKRETARILWKIDWRLVPFLAVLYL